MEILNLENGKINISDTLPTEDGRYAIRKETKDGVQYIRLIIPYPFEWAGDKSPSQYMTKCEILKPNKIEMLSCLFATLYPFNVNVGSQDNIKTGIKEIVEHSIVPYCDHKVILRIAKGDGYALNFKYLPMTFKAAPDALIEYSKYIGFPKKISKIIGKVITWQNSGSIV